MGEPPGFGPKMSTPKRHLPRERPLVRPREPSERFRLPSAAPGVDDFAGSLGSGRVFCLFAFGGGGPDMFLLLVGTDTGTASFGGLSNGFAEPGFGIGFFGAAEGPFCFGAAFFGGDPFIGATDRVDVFVSLTSSTAGDFPVTFAVVCAGFGRGRDGPEAALSRRALRTRYRRRQRKVSQPRMSATVTPPATIPPATARSIVSHDALTGCS
jgi:hypothetical protein